MAKFSELEAKKKILKLAEQLYDQIEDGIWEYKDIEKMECPFCDEEIGDFGNEKIKNLIDFEDRHHKLIFGNRPDHSFDCKVEDVEIGFSPMGYVTIETPDLIDMDQEDQELLWTSFDNEELEMEFKNPSNMEE